MNIRTIHQGFSVSTQILPADMVAIAAKGFRAIICNRPDGEDPGQPPAAEIAAAAAAAGLGFAHVPVCPGTETPDDAQAMARALAALPGPVLAFCRSGNRSVCLAQMADSQRTD